MKLNHWDFIWHLGLGSGYFFIHPKGSFSQRDSGRSSIVPQVQVELIKIDKEVLMKNLVKLKMISVRYLVLALVGIMACAASRPLNDFFGIEMNHEDADEFKIASYTEAGGAQYYSNSRMNPQIYAYARIDVQTIRIKVVNLTNSDIPFNYNVDQFTLITSTDEKYILIKGDRFDYPSRESIKSNQSIQFFLELPSKFWQVIGLSDQNSQDANYINDFWKGENSLVIVKEKIKMIEVSLAGETTLILKSLP